jgi:hypothetical protein
VIILLFSLCFGIWGGFLARRRKGNRLDIAQYAAGFAIFGALLGLVVTIVIGRSV